MQCKNFRISAPRSGVPLTALDNIIPFAGKRESGRDVVPGTNEKCRHVRAAAIGGRTDIARTSQNDVNDPKRSLSPTLSRNGTLWNVSRGYGSLRLDVGRPDHLSPFLGFLGESLPYSAGESARGVLPRSAIRALILGSARPALISRLSLSMISTGVLRGAPRPGPARLVTRHEFGDGRDVRQRLRRASQCHTPSARSLPALMCPMDEAMASKANCT